MLKTQKTFRDQFESGADQQKYVLIFLKINSPTNSSVYVIFSAPTAVHFATPPLARGGGNELPLLWFRNPSAGFFGTFGCPCRPANHQPLFGLDALETLLKEQLLGQQQRLVDWRRVNNPHAIPLPSCKINNMQTPNANKRLRRRDILCKGKSLGRCR